MHIKWERGSDAGSIAEGLALLVEASKASPCVTIDGFLLYRSAGSPRDFSKPVGVQANKRESP